MEIKKVFTWHDFRKLCAIIVVSLIFAIIFFATGQKVANDKTQIIIDSLKIEIAVRDSVLRHIQRWNQVLTTQSKDSVTRFIKADKIKRLNKK